DARQRQQPLPPVPCGALCVGCRHGSMRRIRVLCTRRWQREGGLGVCLALPGARCCPLRHASKHVQAGGTCCAHAEIRQWLHGFSFPCCCPRCGAERVEMFWLLCSAVSGSLRRLVPDVLLAQQVSEVGHSLFTPPAEATERTAVLDARDTGICHGQLSS